MPNRAIATLAAAGLVVGVAVTATLAVTDTPDSSRGHHDLAVLPIQLGATGAGGTTAAGGTKLAAPEAGADALIAPGDGSAWVPPTYDFQIDADLSGLGGTAPVYRFPAGATATVDQIRTLAAALGLSGEPTAADGGGWQVVDGDRQLFVSNDAMGSWWYSAPGPNQVVCAMAKDAVSTSSSGTAEVAPDAGSAVVGTEAVVAPPPSEAVAPETSAPDVSVEPGGDGNVTIPDCPEPTPPTGLPSAGDAESAARAVFAAAGGGDLTVTTNPSEWSVDVNAVPTYDGLPADTGFYVGFGQDAMITYAGGYLLQPERVDDYPLIDGDAAIKRLEDSMQFMPLMYADGATLKDGVASVGGNTASAGGAAGAAEIAPMPTIECVAAPCEPQPAPEPEVITVHITSVVRVVMTQWSQDGTVWVVPGYRFVDADGGWWPVVAVPDQFLPAQPQPVPVAVDEPAPADGVVVDTTAP